MILKNRFDGPLGGLALKLVCRYYKCFSPRLYAMLFPDNMPPSNYEDLDSADGTFVVGDYSTGDKVEVPVNVPTNLPRIPQESLKELLLLTRFSLGLDGITPIVPVKEPMPPPALYFLKRDGIQSLINNDGTVRALGQAAYERLKAGNGFGGNFHCPLPYCNDICAFLEENRDVTFLWSKDAWNVSSETMQPEAVKEMLAHSLDNNGRSHLVPIFDKLWDIHPRLFNEWLQKPRWQMIVVAQLIYNAQQQLNDDETGPAVDEEAGCLCQCWTNQAVVDNEEERVVNEKAG